MRFLITLLSLLLTFSAFAADEKAKAKDTAIVLKGEHKVGVPGTPDDGYKIYFSEDKQANLSLGGYARMMTVFALDNDRATSPASKLYLERFRFHLDGQGDSHWSFHTRFDYRQNSFQTKGETTYGTPGIYVARAYLTYKYNDNLSVDFGRISNQIYRFDVMGKTNVKVANGVMPKYKYGAFSLTGAVNFNNNSQRVTTPSAANNDTPSEIAKVNQSINYGARAGYNFKLTGDYDFGIGFMGQGETDVTAAAEKTTQLMPDLMLSGPRDFYILNQSLKKVHSKATPNVYENYTEIGMGFGQFFPDLNYTLAKENNQKTKHTIAPELLIKHDPQYVTLWTVIFDDYLADSKADKTITFKAYLEFYF